MRHRGIRSREGLLKISTRRGEDAQNSKSPKAQGAIKASAWVVVALRRYRATRNASRCHHHHLPRARRPLTGEEIKAPGDTARAVTLCVLGELVIPHNSCAQPDPSSGVSGDTCAGPFGAWAAA